MNASANRVTSFSVAVNAAAMSDASELVRLPSETRSSVCSFTKSLLRLNSATKSAVGFAFDAIANAYETATCKAATLPSIDLSMPSPFAFGECESRQCKALGLGSSFGFFDVIHVALHRSCLAHQ